MKLESSLPGCPCKGSYGSFGQKTEGAAPRLPRSPSFPHISIYLSDVKAAFMAGRSGWRAPQTGAARVAYETDSGHTDPVHVCMSMLLHVLALARRHTSLTRYQREQSPKPKVVFSHDAKRADWRRLLRPPLQYDSIARSYIRDLFPLPPRPGGSSFAAVTCRRKAHPGNPGSRASDTRSLSCLKACFKLGL